MNLLKGQNVLVGESGLLEVTLEWESDKELDISCFMLNKEGKVPSDDYMIFYNQDTDPELSVKFKPVDMKKSIFEVNLDKLDETIDKCAFTATLDGLSTFKSVEGLKIRLKLANEEVIYEITDATEETALVIGEVYRNKNGFKFRAVGRGFNGGLKPLAESFGVDIADEETVTSEDIEVKEEPEKIKLTKIDLLKKEVKISLSKKNIDREKARVAVVFDASGSMSDLYSRGTVQRAFERVLAIAACMDDDGMLDIWFFGSKCKRTPSVTERDFEDYVTRTFPKPNYDRKLGYGNNEPAVIKDVIKKYTEEEPRKDIPTFVVFFSDGGVYLDKEINKLITQASDKNIFWQFVGLGNANFGALERIDDLPNRFLDNADFFSLSDLDKVSDSDLYNRIFNEFPQWLKEAKNKGILI